MPSTRNLERKGNERIVSSAVTSKTAKKGTDDNAEKTQPGGKQMKNAPSFEDPKMKTAKPCNKRVSTGLHDIPKKKPRTASVGAVSSALEEAVGMEVLSPRRSSRAVVPNSRYKDMVDPRKKLTPAILGKKSDTSSTKESKTPKVVKRGQAQRNSLLVDMNIVEESEESEITEEVVTEETTIDQMAQMNFMAEALKAPPTVESISPPIVKSSHKVGLVQIVRPVEELDKLSTNNDAKLGQSNNSYLKGTNEDVKIEFFSDEKAEVNVVVSESHAKDFAASNEGIIEQYKPTEKIQEMTDENSLELTVDAFTNDAGTEDGSHDKNVAPIIVIPGKPVDYNESNSIAEVKLKSKTKISKMSGKKMVYQQVSKKGQTIITWPTQTVDGKKRIIISTPGENDDDEDDDVDDDDDNDDTSHIQQSFNDYCMPKVVRSMSTQISPEISELQPTKISYEIGTTGSIGGTRTSPSQGSALKPAPRVITTSHILHTDRSKVGNTETLSLGTHEKIVSGNAIIKKPRVFGRPNVEVLYVQNLQKPFTGTKCEKSPKEVVPTCTAEVYTTVSNINKSTVKDIVVSTPADQSPKPIVSHLCEVVEYKPPVKSTKEGQKSYQYVMIDNQMVRMHKPGNNFGRIVGPNLSSEDASSSRTSAQSVLAQLVGNVQQQPSMNVSQVQQVQSSLSIPTGVSKRVVHGHIASSGSHSSESQEVIEISHDAFSREVYGDGEIIVDPFTGANVQALYVQNLQKPFTSTKCEKSLKEVVPTYTAEVYTTVSNINKSTGVEHGHQTEGIAENEEQDPHQSIEATGNEQSTIENPAISADQGSVVCIEGLDENNIPENTRITVESLATGEEAIIFHIDDLEETEKNVVISKLPQVPQSSVVPLSSVKITPVQAYVVEEDEDDTKGASATTQTEETDSETDDDEEEPIEVDMEGGGYELPVIRRGRRPEGTDLQEYVIVQLPEGSVVKEPQARSRIPPPIQQIQDPVTMDDDGLYTCVDCNHKTDKKSNWFKHRRKHLGIRPHGCPKCSYKASTSSNLKRHMQIHDDVRNFACVLCGLHFRQKIHLERHIKYKHSEKRVNCPLCEFTCSSENPELKVHIRKTHMPMDGSMDAFTCDICGLMTISKRDLKQHLKFHKKGPELKLFCEYCSFVTDCTSRLKRHLLIHTKERPFQCGLCQYRATQKEHVLRHMRTQHNVEVETRQKLNLLDIRTITKEDNVIIPKDASATPVNSSKYRHWISDKSDAKSPDQSFGPFEHSDYSSQEKIFACNYCSMKFSRLINLYKHLYAQHETVMPSSTESGHQCVVCDFVTNSKKNLLVHMRKHNTQDHSPPTHVYSCVLCRYMNPRRRNLFQHMKKKHGIEIIMKEDGLNCFVNITLDSKMNIGEGFPISATESGVIALSEIVKTEPVTVSTDALQIMTDINSDKISFHNIISLEDIGTYANAHIESQGLISPSVSVMESDVKSHDAAEAIEGLQALAEQAGILETQNVDHDMTSEIITTEIMNEGEISIVAENDDDDSHSHVLQISHEEGENVTYQNIEELQREVIHGGEVTMEKNDEGLQLSVEQINELSSGDYVEINGEVYKVEIASGSNDNNIVQNM
ncbi:uncharacterized protein LOC128238602 [Mya arenaria]|uniref:uncharacterized protein LOC128238602 n=1 Tax=Mya arenaria TaxID=6604 RepID=UPI0022E8F235|nr:uncharacterized protein LOC128238602 [Mya arenaria]XP_052810657.1 uncharacterized protein LOC128238602 [Mya arenaria]